MTKQDCIAMFLRVADALGDMVNDYRCQQVRKKDDDPPKNVKAFPGKKVGDSLYCCDELEDGVCRYLIISIDKNGFCRVVPAEQDAGWVWTAYGCEWLYASVEEALQKKALEDVDWHKPRLQAAERVLATIESKGDLNQFMDGISMEEPP